MLKAAALVLLAACAAAAPAPRAYMLADSTIDARALWGVTDDLRLTKLTGDDFALSPGYHMLACGRKYLYVADLGVSPPVYGTGDVYRVPLSDPSAAPEKLFSTEDQIASLGVVGDETLLLMREATAGGVVEAWDLRARKRTGSVAYSFAQLPVFGFFGSAVDARSWLFVAGGGGLVLCTVGGSCEDVSVAGGADDMQYSDVAFSQSTRLAVLEQCDWGRCELHRYTLLTFDAAKRVLTPTGDVWYGEGDWYLSTGLGWDGKHLWSGHVYNGLQAAALGANFTAIAPKPNTFASVAVNYYL